jgi:anti-anti-sigma regulatory factor
MTQLVSETNTIRIYGELNRPVDEVEKLLASGTVSVALDFSTCTFMTVEGLEWLEELLLRADSQQAKVTFINIPPSIYKVFKVSHIDSINRACGSPNPVKPGTAVC